MSTRPKFRVESCSNTISPYDPDSAIVKVSMVGFFPKDDAESIQQMLLNRSYTVEQLSGDALIGDAAAEIEVDVLREENKNLEQSLFFEKSMVEHQKAEIKELKDRLAAQWRPGVE